jgi:nitrogen fixation protein NifB
MVVSKEEIDRMGDKVPEHVRKELETHPCYNEKAHTQFARMHLPVAPRCNVQCNYCNRKYDCSNESRPGVTSEVLTPEQAVEKIRIVKEKIPQLTVLGIAGPGDPLANEETFQTLELVQREFPEMTLCLSTNGLILPRSVDRLRKLGVKFITVTINAVDPEVAAKVYGFVVYEGRTYHGREAGELMIKNQLEGIRMSVEAGMLVKANIVMVPGINADEIPAVAKKVKDLGAYMVNIIPMIPVPGSNFEDLRSPTAEERRKLQDMCETDIRQMRHCRFCRADAIGLLGEDRSAEFAHATCGLRNAPKEGPFGIQEEGSTKYQVAVASSDGKDVDLHFGQAGQFFTFEVAEGIVTPTGNLRVDNLPNVAMFGQAHRGKLENMALALKGYDVVVAKSFGDPAKEFLKDDDIATFVSACAVEEAVRAAVRFIFEERARVFE